MTATLFVDEPCTPLLGFVHHLAKHPANFVAHFKQLLLESVEFLQQPLGTQFDFSEYLAKKRASQISGSVVGDGGCHSVRMPV